MSEKSRKSGLSKSRNSKKSYEQIFFRDWCKACGICSAFCPKGVIDLDDSGRPEIKNPDDCIGCRFCELHCPDFAVTVRERRAKASKTDHDQKKDKEKTNPSAG